MGKKDKKSFNETNDLDFKESKQEVKKYVALKTTKILCNKEFKLIEGKEISDEIPEAFIESLINSNLIK